MSVKGDKKIKIDIKRRKYTHSVIEVENMMLFFGTIDLPVESIDIDNSLDVYHENKNKFFMKSNREKNTIEINFTEKKIRYIINSLVPVKYNGYSIEKFICKDENNEDVFIDIEKMRYTKYSFWRNYLYNTMPENISYCKVYFRPKYNIFLRNVNYYKNNLHYQCSNKEEFEYIKQEFSKNKEFILNIDNKKITVVQNPTEYSVKFNKKYFNHIKFYENTKKGEIFTYNKFPIKCLLIV